MQFCIVGSGRCGSSLLGEMFFDHPDVLIYFESYWQMAMLNRFGLSVVAPRHLQEVLRTTGDAMRRPLIDSTLHRLGLSVDALCVLYEDIWGDAPVSVADFNERLASLLLQRSGKEYIGSKTPHYGFHMGTLRTIWPEMRFVHIIRNGVSVAQSMRKHQGFRLLARLGIDDWTMVAQTAPYLELPLDTFSPFSYLRVRLRRLLGLALPAERPCLRTHLSNWLRRPMDLPRLPECEPPLTAYLSMWARQVSRIRDEATRLASEDYLEIRYEELLQSPRETLEAVCQFTGVPVDAEWTQRQIASLKVEKARPAPFVETPEVEAVALLNSLGYLARNREPHREEMPQPVAHSIHSL